MSNKLCSHKILSTLISLFMLVGNYNSSLGEFTDLLQNNDEDPTLGDIFPEYIVSNLFFDDIICKENYESAKYPYKKIIDVINSTGKKSSYPTPRLTDGHIVYDLQGSLNSITSSIEIPDFVKGDVRSPLSPCKEIYQRIYPLRGKSMDGKSHTIINVKGYQQRTDIITCHKSGSACNQKITPENYTSSCRQMYRTEELSTFPDGKNITSDAREITSFRIPSGCLCQQSRKNIKT